MALSLDAPIEDLKLSNRVRNVLRRRGFNTVGSLLERDYKPVLRGFGPVARAELACALDAEGLAPPANLSLSESINVAHDLSRLREQMEAIFQKWSGQIEHLERRLQGLEARGPHRHRCPSVAKHVSKRART